MAPLLFVPVDQARLGVCAVLPEDLQRKWAGFVQYIALAEHAAVTIGLQAFEDRLFSRGCLLVR